MNRLRWSAFALAAVLACGCGGGKQFNPTPALTGLFPSDVTAGSQPFTVFIGGSNFQSNSTAQWNGIDRPAVFNDATSQIAMTILDADVANPGSGQITVTNPLPGGGVSQTAFPLVVNPAAVGGPVITSISPTSVVAGSNSAVTLTVTGNNLVASDVIAFNGTPLTTTASGSPTQLTANISAEDIVAVGLASISVQTNQPGIASPSVKFPIGPQSNPTPKLASISPSSTKVGTLPPGNFLLLTGTGFVPGSVVNFNGTPRATGYSSATQLAVSLVPSDVASGGTIAVTVTNPNPGGGASSASNLTIQ